jgi:2-oxo-4-hydroxy-4-carboxy-5-ureidoimidazoline decarboxylase
MASHTLEALNRSTDAEFVTALGAICEHAPKIAEAVAKQRPFASLAALNAAFAGEIRGASGEARMALLHNHPDLAGKAARAGTLTADSAREQTSAGLGRLSDAEYTAFFRLNDAYRAKFGFPFILCVRRHSKGSILAQFEARLTNSEAVEFDTALGEIARIVALRLDQAVAAPDKLKVHGRLSTHVLDLQSGCPALGMEVELAEIEPSGAARTLVRAKTDGDGRTNSPLIAGCPLPIGSYELRFWVAAYFRARSETLATPPFLDIVPVRFGIAEPEGHYHVPLLVTPWTYTTYRGS